MLTRFTCDNYKCLVNFVFQPAPLQLLMGRNGAGKTSIFDALAGIRDLLVEGEKCEDLFPLSSIPRWLKGDKPQLFQQRFEIDLEGEEGVIRYELVVEQDEKLARSRVLSESLTSDDKPLFAFREGKVQLYRDNHSPGPEYTSDWNRSALGSVLPGPDNRHLTWFKERIRAVECVRIDAPRMAGRSEREEPRPERDLSNFPSWYRRALITNTSESAQYFSDLRDVIAGMQSLDLHELGQGIMVLRAAFARPAGLAPKPGKYRTFWLEFNELSDGQRTLIGLYALLHFVVRDNATLCIDEPDNFVALAEIQPWLSGVQDRVDNLGAQVLIASHHPELLNQLATRNGIIVERAEAGPAAVRPFAPADDTLTPAEIVARGWENA
jgi:hypothetical protein